ncbi:MAG: hypothetical protein HC802_05405 [Caldilineaceae bacterium]|nr:hypothetical protein [Caldilineaceae bacterium]
MATVATAVLNVRSGPSTAYPVVGQLTLNQSCPVVGRDLAATWWQLKCSAALNGWVAAQLVTVSGSTANVPVTEASAPPPPAATPTPAPPPVVAGWTASYFSNRDLAGSPAVVETVPEVNFNWGAGSPAPQIPPDNFSARFERLVNFPAGTYRLTLQYDDGVRVYVDNQLVLDDWKDGTERTSSVDVAIAAGNHTVKIEYYEAYGGAVVRFTWATINGNVVAPTPVPPPPSNVVPPPVPSNGDWQVTYWNNPDLAGSPVYAQIEPRTPYPIDKNWGTNSPAPGVNNTNWSARYVANYYLDAGDYTFETTSDDGVRVYLDGQVVIDAWSDGYKQKSNNFNGVGKGSHQITVEFYQRLGTAQLTVKWWKISQDYNFDE